MKQKIIPKSVVMVGDVRVFCGYTKLVPPAELKPHPMNPNTHSPEQIDLYWRVLQANGIRRPVTVSTRSGFITKGHGQVQAALYGALPDVPVEYQQYEDEESELADIAADNRLGELSKRDNAKMGELLTRLDTGEFDMARTGYDEVALEDFMTRVGTIPEIEYRGDGEEGAERAGDPTGTEDEKPTSHVRMVQLFLNEKNLPEFMKMTEQLQKHYGKENLTDTVMEAIRETWGFHPMDEL